jgi:hypothetical protein
MSGQILFPKGSMRRIARIILLLFVAHCGNAQVLENYEGKWSNSTEQPVLGSIVQKQVTLAANTFPQSFFRFKVPGNSTLFVDGRLWDMIQNDTTFFIATSEFKKEFGKDSLLITVVSDKFKLRNFDLEIAKVARNRVEEKQVNFGAKLMAFEKRQLVQPMKDFIAVSLLIILMLLGIYRRIYPYLLGVLLQPLSVIKAEDFSESGGLQKVFSFDIIYFLFLLAMIISHSLVVGIVIFRPDWIEIWGGLTSLSLLSLWIITSFLLLAVTILKFSVIKLIVYLFELGKSEFAHFFYLLRLISFGFGFVLLATTFLVINDISELEIVFTQLIQVVFWAYLVGVFGLFLIMMNRLNFKKYHLFTYLCLSEIIPFLVLTKWVLEFIK